MTVNAVEGPAPVYGAPPPDQMPQGLGDLLNQAFAMITRDGGIDEEEMRQVGAFFQSIQLFVQKAQQPQAQSRFQAPPDMRADNAQTDDYGSGQGEPLEEPGGY